MTTVEWDLVIGSKEGCVVDFATDGGLLALRIVRDGAYLVVPARLASFQAIPGYERVVERSIGRYLEPGSTLQVTWLGIDEQGLAKVAVAYKVQGQLEPIEGKALAKGWAVPTADILAVPPLRLELSGPLRDAARTRSGAWADAAEQGQLTEYAIQDLGVSARDLRPSYPHANPGVAVLVGIILLIGLGSLVRRENEAFKGWLQERKVGLLGRMLLWGAHLHLRYLRPVSKTSLSKEKESDGPRA